MSASWRRRTQSVHGGREASHFGENAEALFLTSGFRYERAEDAADRFAERQAGYQYSRVANPTVRMFEERLAQIEGAEDAAATATGMAAVHAVLMALLRAGDRVVAARLLFGSCHYILSELLPRFGIEVVLVDGRDLDAWAEALAKPTTLVFFESPGNPTLDLVDIEAVSALAHRAGAKVIVDNVFATPIDQHPLSLGADLVVYSATKHIDGQGRCMGGAILCARELRNGPLQTYLKNTGPVAQPVQRLGDAQGPGDPGAAGARPCRGRGRGGGVPGAASGRRAGALSRAREPPAARARAPPDGERRRPGGVSGRGRAGS